MLEVNAEISIPFTELDFTYSRSSGPGGQNVNKVNSKVQLRWSVQNTQRLPVSVKLRLMEKYGQRITNDGDLIISSSRFRDQGRNVGDTLQKLRELILSVATPPKPRKTKRISTASKRRRLDTKRKQSEKKQTRKSPKFD